MAKRESVKKLIQSFCNAVAKNEDGLPYLKQYVDASTRNLLACFYTEIPQDFKRIFNSRLRSYPGYTEKYGNSLLILNHMSIIQKFYRFDTMDDAVKAVKSILQYCIDSVVFKPSPHEFDEAICYVKDKNLQVSSQKYIDFVDSILKNNLFESFCVKGFLGGASRDEKNDVLFTLSYIFSRYDFIENKEYQEQIANAINNVLIPNYSSPIYWNGIYECYSTHYKKIPVERDFFDAMVKASKVTDEWVKARCLLKDMDKKPAETICLAMEFIRSNKEDLYLSFESYSN